MAPRTGEKKEGKSASKKQPGTKKASGYQMFMKKEMARLKESEPDMPHKDRFRRAAQSWQSAKENPKNKK